MDPQSRPWPRPQYLQPQSSSNVGTLQLPPLSNLSAHPVYQPQDWSGPRDAINNNPPQSYLPLKQQEDSMNHTQPGAAKSEGAEDSLPSTSDFVKKLYKMLEDQSFQHIVCWGPHGDCFVVKDMTEFTKAVLPRLFKHSNFASFVRQLNKYDFHKVKNTDDGQFGEHSWTFRHPDFALDRPDALENIKRKVPAARKSQQASSSNWQGSASSTKPLAAATSASGSPTPSYPPYNAQQVEALQGQLDRLTRAQEEAAAHIRNLERNYQDVLVEMVGFQRNMAQQDGLMQNLIQYLLQVENSGAPLPPGGANPFLPTREAQRLFSGSNTNNAVAGPSTDPTALFPQLGRESLLSMNDLSRRIESNANPQSSRIWSAAQSAGLIPSTPPNDYVGGQINSRQEALQRIEELQRTRPASRNMLAQRMVQVGQGLASLSGGGGGDPGPSTLAAARLMPPPPPPVSYGSSESSSSSSPDGEEEVVMPSPPQINALVPTGSMSDLTTPAANHEGLAVYTVGHLMPKSSVDDQNGNWIFDPSTLTLPSSSPPSSASPPPQTTDGGGQKLRVRRSTYVPGWAVSPRVLLVDDDAVSRKLSSKFLQVFGCTIDVAVDGVEAVNKTNLEKYDLVLMDIVMPKLDGVSATSLIRKFDARTPIISMTSNAKPSQIVSYYSSGMNDVLPKPFTKQGMLDVLERHLTHLKAIQQMSRSIPRPPANEFDLAPYDDGRINPLAGMGLSDQQYNAILQNIVDGETFGDVGGASSGGGGVKRELEDSEDGRGNKRSRFEVVE